MDPMSEDLMRVGKNSEQNYKSSEKSFRAIRFEILRGEGRNGKNMWGWSAKKLKSESSPDHSSTEF